MRSKSIIDLLHWILGMFFNFALVVVVLVVLYLITIRGFEFGGQMANEWVAVGEDYEVEFVLDVDTPASEVARELEYLGIINNRLLFNIELFLMGGIRMYEAGTYVLNHNMSYREIRQVFGRTGVGQAPHEDITVLEGWTMRDMAEYFESRGFFTAEEFIRVATEGVGQFGFAFERNIPADRPNGLEGYLFPDTYQIPVNPTPGDIIVRMLRRFDYVFNVEMRDQAYEMGMTMDEVVIMASIIEMESRLAQERPKVSQVIHNRMAIGMYLQMCSTVKYTMEDPPVVLSTAQTQVDTPFNTYTRPGLPIGPITNPGAAALRAVVNPSGGNYLFFVLYNFETGEHFFSDNYTAHRAANDRAIARQPRQ